MKKLFAIGSLSIVALGGCSGDVLNSIDPGGGASTATVVSLRAESASKSPNLVENTGATVAAPSGEPASVLGRFTFDGAPPTLAPRVVKGTAAADKTVCAKDGDILNESVVVGAKGELANVFIYLEKAPKGFTVAPVTENPLSDQQFCVFKPHALIVRAGVPFNLKNSDTVTHNVKTSPGKNPSENIGMAGGATEVMKFKAVEKAPFESSCAIHSWMNFYTLVLDHPFAAVSDAEGKFEIKDLPPGEHQFRIWHERSGPVETRKVKVVGGSPVDVGEIKIPAAKFKL